jgi:5'-3' exonuclease
MSDTPEFKLDHSLIPTVESSVGLVDADSIMFNLGWYYIKADILPDDKADYRNSTVAPPEIHKAVETFLDKLREQMNVTTLHLHFTGSSKNQGLFEEFNKRPMLEQFRNTLGCTYKSNRKEAALPAGYHYTLRVLLEKSKAYIHDQWEADDAIILHKKLNPDYVLSSNDKDVYGQHFGTSWLYDKRRKWVDIDKGHANYFAFLQAITGDPVDGFGGVPGIGPAKAAKFVSVDNTPTQNWEGVLAAFDSKGLDEEEALINMRFANMHQLSVNKDGAAVVDLWKPEGKHLEPVW